MIPHVRRPSWSLFKAAHNRSLRVAIHATTAVVAGVVVALSQSGTGHADPSPSEVEAQIDQQWQALEPIIEQHNKVRIELDANRARSDDLAKALQPLQLQVELAQSRISNLSVNRYKGGSTSAFNAMLTGGSPQGLADQLTLFDQVARNEMAAIKGVVELKAQYEAEKRPLDDLLAEQTRQEADLASKEKVINDQVKALNDLRVKVYGTSGVIGNTRPVPCPFDYANDVGGKAAKVACAQIGKAYIWAAQGPANFDCSGLTLYAWAQADPRVQLRHYTNWQYNDTQRVARDQLKPGDLIFYFSGLSHMAINVGGGWMVHAPNSGDVVRMARIDSLPVAGYGRPRT